MTRLHARPRTTLDHAAPYRQPSQGEPERSDPTGLLALQAKAGNAAVVQLLRSTAGAGTPLAAGVRSRMEDAFGRDFSSVRVHRGPEASATARALGARAYTIGEDVVVGGAGEASSPAAQRVLAHELAHVVQQREGPVAGRPGPAGLQVSDPSDRFERQAEQVADRVAAGSSAAMAPPIGPPAGGAAGTAQRQVVQRLPTLAEDALEQAESVGLGSDTTGALGDLAQTGFDLHANVVDSKNPDPTADMYVPELGFVTAGVSAFAAGAGAYGAGRSAHRAKREIGEHKEAGHFERASATRRERRAQIKEASGSSAGSSNSLVNAAVHGATAGMALAGPHVSTATSATLVTAGGVTGGAGAIAVSPVTVALSAFNAYKNIKTAAKAGDQKRHVFDHQRAVRLWQRRAADLPGEIAKLEKRDKKLGDQVTALDRKLGASQRFQSRRAKTREKKLDDRRLVQQKVTYKREEQGLVAADLAMLGKIGGELKMKDAEQAWSDQEVKDAKEGGKRSASDTDAPENLGEILGFFQQKKRTAEWRGAVEATGSTLQGVGATTSSVGGLLTIVGAAGVGLGAVPGLVVTAAGSLTSLGGTAVSGVSQGHKLYRAGLKRFRGTKGTVRRTMADHLLMYVIGVDPSVTDVTKVTDPAQARARVANSSFVAALGPGGSANGHTNPVTSTDRDQKRAWGFMVNSLQLPEYRSYERLRKAVEDADVASKDPKRMGLANPGEIATLRKQIFAAFASNPR